MNAPVLALMTLNTMQTVGLGDGRADDANPNPRGMHGTPL
jgi:hypothetical protein